MHTYRTRSRLLASILLLSASSWTASCGHEDKPATNISSKPLIAQADKKSLDLVFEGTWAFVVAADGSVTAYTPQIQAIGHSLPYIRAVDEQPLPQGQYSLKIDKYVPPGQTDYDSTAPYSEFKLSYAKPINTNGAEYLSLHLPKPTSFVHTHLDLQQFQTTDPGDADATNPLSYPTIMALRYDLSDLTSVTFSCANNCIKDYSPQIPVLGNEQVVTLAVDPLKPDDGHHHHAKKAFRALIALFPEFNLWITFPKPSPKTDSSKPKVSPDMVNGPGKDCRASVLILQPK